MENNGYLWSDLWDTMSALSANPALRKETETELKKDLPDDFDIHIDPAGIGHLECPLFVTQGYGLNEEQQRYAAKLWAWQKESLKSKIILGGPIEG